MQRKLLTNGNIHKRTDGRWNGVIWYRDEEGTRQRKSFCGNTKAEVKAKITEYIAVFREQADLEKVSNQRLSQAMQEWLEVFKFPSVRRVTYDRDEQVFNMQIKPALGKKVVSDITAADIKKMMTDLANKGYSYSTMKQAYGLLRMFFRYLEGEELILKNPMKNVIVPNKASYLASQGKEYKPTCETVVIFTPEEIEKMKAEIYKIYGNGVKVHSLATAFILMLNTGLRTGEALGLRNCDIDLENKVLHVNQAVKEVNRRDGSKKLSGKEVVVGPPKSSTSKRTVPLNEAAINAVNTIREERFFGEDAPLICDVNGYYISPNQLRKRFYRILEGAGLEQRGLHALRHTFATTLINGIKQEDGSLKSLSVKQVADILGHTTSEVTEMYYVKKDTSRLVGMTDGFEI